MSKKISEGEFFAHVDTLNRRLDEQAKQIDRLQYRVGMLLRPQIDIPPLRSGESITISGSAQSPKATDRNGTELNAGDEVVVPYVVSNGRFQTLFIDNIRADCKVVLCGGIPIATSELVLFRRKQP